MTFLFTTIPCTECGLSSRVGMRYMVKENDTVVADLCGLDCLSHWVDKQTKRDEAAIFTHNSDSCAICGEQEALHVYALELHNIGGIGVVPLCSPACVRKAAVANINNDALYADEDDWDDDEDDWDDDWDDDEEDEDEDDE